MQVEQVGLGVGRRDLIHRPHLVPLAGGGRDSGAGVAVIDHGLDRLQFEVPILAAAVEAAKGRISVSDFTNIDLRADRGLGRQDRAAIGVACRRCADGANSLHPGR